MCGVAGRISRDGLVDATALGSALGRMESRGPDDVGRWSGHVGGFHCALGHRRLAIVDLSADGRQPMRSTDGRYVITFNGEIYNYPELRSELAHLGHSFRTATDTEVLLAAWAQWGEAALPRLRGMFAFVVIDQQRQRMTLVRDPFGIKPLYWARGDGWFSFASQPSALRALMDGGCQVDVLHLQRFLAGAPTELARTFTAGVTALEPGSLLRLDLGAEAGTDLAAGQTLRWWKPSIVERRIESFEAAAEQLRELIFSSIRMHLRGDVPVALALSGGLDSSTIATIVRRLDPTREIHTYSFVAPGQPWDERAWIREVQQAVDSVGHCVEVAPDEFSDDLDALLAAHDEPIPSPSVYAQYRVFKQAHANGVKVVLEGQGADETFGGYHGYPGARLASLLSAGQWVSAARFLHRWSTWPGRARHEAVRAAVGELTIPMRSERRRHRLPPWLAEVEGVACRSFALTAESRLRRLADRLREAQSTDALGSLLRHSDRNSMAWSVESRVPFLSPDIVEFALGLPERFLVSDGGESKRILRAAMRGIVPDAIVDRRDKVGFAGAQTAWMGRAFRDVSYWSERVRALPGIRHGPAVAAMTDVCERRAPVTPGIWRLASAASWFAESGLSGPGQ